MDTITEEEKLLASMAAAIFGASTTAQKNIEAAVAAAKDILVEVRKKTSSK